MKVTGVVDCGERSLAKQVIVGNVPDRGGRVNELRTKKVNEGRKNGYRGGGGGSQDFGNRVDHRPKSKNQDHNDNGNGNKHLNIKNKIEKSDKQSDTLTDSGRVVVLTKDNKLVVDNETGKPKKEQPQHKKGRR
jgi:hypothetical protein